MTSPLRVFIILAACSCFGSGLPKQAVALLADQAPPPSTWELRYRRPLGQVATYRLSLQVEGVQTSLGERRPVRIRAELELTEEVIAQEVEGAAWLRVHARVLEVRDPTGTFAGLASQWPELKIRASPRGEVLDVSPAARESQLQPFERAFTSLMASAAGAPVVLPPSGLRVALGEEWEWEHQGARQQNRLLRVEGEGDRQVAHIASTASSPLALEESIEALGLRTHLTGDQTCTSELELLLTQGLVARHRGETRLRTRSQVALELEDGTQEFPLESTLRLLFDLRLTGVR